MKIILILLMSLSLFASDYSFMIKSFEKGDTSRAIAYARNNATNGNVAAMYDLGLLYYSQGDIESASKWLNTSVKNAGKGKFAIALIMFSRAEYSNVIATLSNSNSGELSRSLLSVSQDLLKNRNSASADEYLLIGKLFFMDEIVHVDSNLALLLIEKSAKKGNAEALEIMGDAYNIMRSSNLKAPQYTNSLSTALEYYAQAGNRGNYDALAKMGELHIIGPRNIRKVQYGIDFIKKSANSGSALGAKMLGDLYMNGKDFNGLGLGTDTKKALKWYQNATDICEKNSALVTAFEYKQYYATCYKDSSEIPSYSLLFQEF